MTLKEIDCADMMRSQQAMVLVNDAEAGTGAGDPLELALLEYAAAQGVDAAQSQGQSPRLILPFASTHKYMRVTVMEAGRAVSYLKGAPEIVIGRNKLSAAEQQE